MSARSVLANARRFGALSTASVLCSSDELAFAVRTRFVSGRILHNGEAQPQRLFNVPIVRSFSTASG